MKHIIDQTAWQESCNGIRCSECSMSDETGSCRIDEYIHRQPVYEERPHGEWIPVSERLPEENKTVIASTKYGVYSEARYSKEYGWEWAYESGSDYWVELEEVNAWMPLPEPYKKEGE